MQALDVVLFSHSSTSTDRRSTLRVCTGLNKEEFLAVIEEIRLTFKISSVQSLFRKTVLYPYNPAEVLCRPRRAASTVKCIPKPAIHAGDSSYRAGTAQKVADPSVSTKPCQRCQPDSRQGQQTRPTCCPGNVFLCQGITHPGAYRGMSFTPKPPGIPGLPEQKPGGLASNMC